MAAPAKATCPVRADAPRFFYAATNSRRTRSTNVVATNGARARVEAARVLGTTEDDVHVTPVRLFGTGG